MRSLNFKVLACWLIVALPLGWGLYQSVQKAKPLFSGGMARPAAGPKP